MTDHQPPPNESAIAIIAMGCRFPQAPDCESFWALLCQAREGLSHFDEAALIRSGVPRHIREQDNYIPVKGIIECIDQFDAAFFGFAQREAELLDPQHRLLLEMCWEVLERSGYTGTKLRVGMFAGASANSYRAHILDGPQENLELFSRQIVMGNDREFLPTMISYKLDLTGPSINVQTACSTSLVAVHLACQSLLLGECDLALAGAVSIILPIEAGYLYQEGMIFSPDGHCRPFDAQAAGTISGHGLGVVGLRRFDDALLAGDRIEAVILGSAINNDGSDKLSYSAPGVNSQAALVAEALVISGSEPEDIGYVEAHGTGTHLGDPIEIEALKKAFGETEGKGFCLLGSVKSNIGHLDTAAGMAGLIKVALMLQHRRVPPSLHFSKPNPKIDFQDSPFRVNTELCDWVSVGPRRAGVSAFGIGGTNVHMILEEAPRLPAATPGPTWQLLPLSAKNEKALETIAFQLADLLEKDPSIDLADMAFTLQVGRRHFSNRRVLLCFDRDEAIQKLRNSSEAFAHNEVHAKPPLFFLFPGQGSQKPGMGMSLYREDAPFRNALDECAEILLPILDQDIRKMLAREDDLATSLIKQTQYAQPLIFSVSYALAQSLIQRGIAPEAMAGHSLGEYVAATIAGVFHLPDVLQIIATRGQLMQAMEPGSMLALPLSERDATSFLDSDVCLAAVNGPKQTVVSGAFSAIQALQLRLQEMNIQARILDTSHAFHSPMMSGVVNPLRELIERFQLSPPKVPFLSNLSGDWVSDEQATDPAYWAAHLCQPVRFGDNLNRLLEHPEAVLLEVGPGRTLSGLVAHAANGSSALVLPTLASDKSGEGRVVLLATLGRLWSKGIVFDWDGLNGEGRRRIPLPSYPFERKRTWVELTLASTTTETERAAPAEIHSPGDDLSQWFYQLDWTLAPLEGISNQPHLCIVFGSEAMGLPLAGSLEGLGAEVVFISTIADLKHTLEGHKQGSAAPSIIYLPPGGEQQTSRNLENLSQVLGAYFHEPIELSRLCNMEMTSPCRILAVTTNAWDVVDGEKPDPFRVCLAGPALVIPDEWPQLDFRHIDMDTAATDPSVAPLLLAELNAPRDEGVVAYRKGQRYRKYCEPTRLDDGVAVPPILKEKGTYLITGGMGGMGLVLGRYLAQKVGARVLLLNRTPFPNRDQWTHLKDPFLRTRIDYLHQIEEAGGSFEILCQDVTDEKGMRELLAEVCGPHGRIDGVIHAAGIQGSGLLDKTTPRSQDAVLAPKIEGALVLERIFREQPLDFFILCSSLNALIGGLGQTDYCAANNMLDAFARAGSPSSKWTCSITWGGPWLMVGMAQAHQRAQLTPLSHPLFEGRYPGADNSWIYVSCLDPQQDWVLKEHVIAEKPTMPGTALVEMARFATSDQLKVDSVMLRDVLFLRPLVVERTRVIHTRITRDADGLVFEILCPEIEDENLRLFVTGRAQILDQDQDQVNLLALESNMVEAPLSKSESKAIQFGARWENQVRRLHRENLEGISFHNLDPRFHDDLLRFGLHPALLDNATGSLVPPNTPALPSGYAEIRFWEAMPERIISQVTTLESAQANSLVYDVSIYNPEGRKLVEMREYTLRSVTSTAHKQTIRQALHTTYHTGRFLEYQHSTGLLEIDAHLFGGSMDTAKIHGQLVEPAAAKVANRLQQESCEPLEESRRSTNLAGTAQSRSPMRRSP